MRPITQASCLCCGTKFSSGVLKFCSDACKDQYFERVKAANPMREFCARIGIKLTRDGSRFKGLCPFHTEKTGSFTVYPVNGAYCYGCNWSGDVIALCAKLEGLSPLDAALKLDNGALPSFVAPRRVEAKPKSMLLPPIEKPSRSDLHQLSVLRGIPVAALQFDVERGFLWFFNDDVNGRCWLYKDGRNKCAIRRRLDGNKFLPRNGKPTKAAVCPGSDTKSPLGYQEAADYPYFVVSVSRVNGAGFLFITTIKIKEWKQQTDGLISCQKWPR